MSEYIRINFLSETCTQGISLAQLWSFEHIVIVNWINLGIVYLCIYTKSDLDRAYI